jgi:hypothetical protein
LEKKLENVKEAHSDMGTRAFHKTMIAAGAATTGLITGRTKVMVKDAQGVMKLERRKLFGVPYGLATFGVTTLAKNKLGRFGEGADYFGNGAMAFEVGRASEAAGDKWREAAAKTDKKKKPAGEEEPSGTPPTKGLPDGAMGRGMSPESRNKVASFISAQQ